MLYKAARDVHLVPSDLYHNKDLATLIVDMTDNDTDDEFKIICEARKASKKCLKDGSLQPFWELADDNILIRTVLERLPGKQGSNATNVEQSPTRTRTTSACHNQGSALLEASNITRRATFAQGTKDDPVELVSPEQE